MMDLKVQGFKLTTVRSLTVLILMMTGGCLLTNKNVNLFLYPNQRKVKDLWLIEIRDQDISKEVILRLEVQGGLTLEQEMISKILWIIKFSNLIKLFITLNNPSFIKILLLTNPRTLKPQRRSLKLTREVLLNSNRLSLMIPLINIRNLAVHYLREAYAPLLPIKDFKYHLEVMQMHLIIVNLGW